MPYIDGFIQKVFLVTLQYPTSCRKDIHFPFTEQLISSFLLTQRFQMMVLHPEISTKMLERGYLSSEVKHQTPQ